MTLFRRIRIYAGKLLRALRDLKESFVSTGLKGLVRHGWGLFGRLIGRRAEATTPTRSSFDLQHQVDTDGVIAIEHLDIASANYALGHKYQGVDPETLARIIQSLEVACERYTFVDLGSGKGRALLVASAFPFKRIVGVEYAQDLHEVALKNIRQYSGPSYRGGAIESLCMDATEFQFPEEPLVVLMYNPFEPRLVLKVLKNAQESYQRQNRDITIIYLNLNSAVLKAFSQCERAKRMRLEKLPSNSNQQYAIYKFI